MSEPNMTDAEREVELAAQTRRTVDETRLMCALDALAEAVRDLLWMTRDNAAVANTPQWNTLRRAERYISKEMLGAK